MGIARNILLAASRNRFLAQNVTRRSFARRAVKKFMPGETLGAALQAARDLSARNIGCVITKLGETLTGESQADAVRDHYLEAYDVIQRQRLPAVVSVKPTQLGLDHSFETCLGHLQTLAAKASATGSELWIDMEDSSYVDRTVDLYRRVKQQYQPIGIAIQAYLFRTPKDVEALMDVKPMIRMVKGAYAEPPNVAFPKKSDVDAQYVAVGEKLLAAAKQGNARPIFGTHDLTIVRHLTGEAARIGLDRSAYEVHMLYGIRSQEQIRLASEGYKVRCLISYGEQWFPWYMRRLAERPANVSFVLRSMFMR